MSDQSDDAQKFGGLPIMWADDITLDNLELPLLRGGRPVEMDRTPVKVTGDPLHPVLWRGRQWAVTTLGVECLDGNYAFEADRLSEDIPGHSWPEHMSEKDWVDTEDFATAWLVAIALHNIRIPGGREGTRRDISKMWRRKDSAS